MSDIPPTTAEQGSGTAPPPAKETSPLRLILLLLVFGVALVGLLYDYTIARPAIQKADETIQAVLEGTIKDPNNDGGVTEAEVQDLLGRQPSTVKQLENGKIEIYSWRSGLPYRTYDLYVVYSGQKLPLLYSASTNEEPTGSRLPEKSAPLKKMTDDELKSFVPRQPSGVGGPGAAPVTPKMEPKVTAPGGEKADGGTQDMPVPTDDQPKSDEPAPTTEPAKEEPAPAAEPAKEEPAKEQPPAGEQPAPEEPPKAPDGGGQV